MNTDSLKKIKKLNGASIDSVFLAAVKFVTTVSAVIQTKILSVGLSLTDNGTYSQINIVLSIFTSLLLLGLGDAINYFYNRESIDGTKDKVEAAINTIFLIEALLGILAVAVILTGNRFIVSYFSNERLPALLAIVCMKPMMDNMLYFYQVLFVSIGKSKMIAARNFIISITKLIVSYIAVMIFKTLTIILVSLMVLDIIQLIIFAMVFQRKGFFVNPLKGKLSSVKPILAYGLPMGIYAFSNVLMRDTDRLVVGNLSTTEELAIYTNCSKILPFDIISVSFATVLIPFIMKYVSSKQFEKAEYILSNYFKIGYYSSWILGAAVLICSRQAVVFLYSEEYLPGLAIFIIYIFDSMVKFASMHLVITANGDTKYLMSLSVICLGLNVVLNIGLYFVLGYVGPAVSTLLVTIAYTLLVMRKSMRILEAPITRLFDFKDISLFLLSLMITSVVFSYGNSLLMKGGVNPSVSMIMTMAAFCLANLVLHRNKILKVFTEINKFKIHN